MTSEGRMPPGRKPSGPGAAAASGTECLPFKGAPDSRSDTLMHFLADKIRGTPAKAFADEFLPCGRGNEDPRNAGRHLCGDFHGGQRVQLRHADIRNDKIRSELLDHPEKLLLRRNAFRGTGNVGFPQLELKELRIRLDVLEDDDLGFFIMASRFACCGLSTLILAKSSRPGVDVEHNPRQALRHAQTFPLRACRHASAEGRK